MARHSLIVAFMIVIFAKCAFGESAYAVVGEPLRFPVPESCKTDASATLSRVVGHSTQPVASREGGVCKPAKGYEDRVELTSCFAFTRTFYADSGMYELSCDDKLISLEVVYAATVFLTEGEPGRLPCYYMTRSNEQHPDSIWWRKDRQDVLVRNLDTGDTKYGLGFKSRVSLPSDGAKTGNWSLILDQVQLQDEGVYYCSAQRKNLSLARGSPAAVRLKVIRRKLNQTTPRPHLTTTRCVPEERSWTFDGWTAAVTALLMFVIVAPLCFLLGWCLKTRCRPGDPPGPGGGQYAQVKKEINGNVPEEIPMNPV